VAGVSPHPRIAERAREARYSFPEASSLVKRPSQTLRRWSLGNRRTYRGKRRIDEPLIEVDGNADDATALSFLNLLELRFLASYRQQVSLPAIRRALDYAAYELDTERPLLDLDFKIHGRDLFLRFAENADEPYFVNASRRGQMAWPPGASDLLDALEYDEQERAAFRWWPLGKQRPVVVDTSVNGGRPTTARNRVRTISIATRAREGWPTAAIAADVAATHDEVRAALELEDAAAAA
jgi:uncharacterized protein (DUF433 family)